jgi:hypothetical protein
MGAVHRVASCIWLTVRLSVQPQLSDCAELLCVRVVPRARSLTNLTQRSTNDTIMCTYVHTYTY